MINDYLNKILQGDALSVLKKLPSNIINCVVTSPPYWALRDYGVKGQLGLEQDFNEYIYKLCNIFDEVKRVLRDDGVIFVNIGDTYYGGGNNRGRNSPISKKQSSNKGAVGQVQTKWGKDYKSKCLTGIPFRFALEMINRGWILRNTIIFYKPNVMPSSIKDRFTVDFEYVFFFSKKKKYYFKQQFEPLKVTNVSGIKFGGNKLCKDNATYSGNEYDSNKLVNGRNKRCVWKVSTKGFKGAHFATFNRDLIRPMIDAGCPVNGIVLDPFIGSGTTAIEALSQGKNFIGIELNPDYIKMAEERIKPLLSQDKLGKWVE